MISIVADIHGGDFFFKLFYMTTNYTSSSIFDNDDSTYADFSPVIASLKPVQTLIMPVFFLLMDVDGRPVLKHSLGCNAVREVIAYVWVDSDTIHDAMEGHISVSELYERAESIVVQYIMDNGSIANEVNAAWVLRTYDVDRY